MQALKSQIERDLQAKEEEGEEGKRSLLRQVDAKENYIVSDLTILVS